MKAQVQYEATTRLTSKDGDVLAEIGETCEQVPAASLPWLIEQRIIVPVKEAKHGEV